MKQCSKCEETKPNECFYKNSRDKNKLRNACKKCTMIDTNNWRLKNPDKVKIICDNGYKRNRENRIKSTVKWRLKNPEKNREYCKKYWHKNLEINREKSRRWGKLNKHKKIAFNIKRRAKKIGATPKWLTKEQLNIINNIYKRAGELSEISFDLKFHVDHIIPLQGKEVCGLHVPWNLQILTAEENCSKRNKIINQGVPK